MKSLLLLFAAAVLLTGCAARTSVPEEERVHKYELPHALPRAAAYQAAELWVAETYNSGKTVVDLKQPESGTIILKPLIDWHAGGSLGAHIWSPYSMKITNADNLTKVTITLHGAQAGGDAGAGGQFPPSSEMPKIKAQFDGLADSLGKALKP